MRPLERVKVRFDRLAHRGEAALIPYFVAGYPSAAVTRECLWQAYEAGASLVELGIPFSDPVADGPTIERATHAALRKGMTPRKALRLVAELRREGYELPILGMTYANLAFQDGPGRALEAWRRAGLDGAILPDVPPEESRLFRQALRRQGLAEVCFAAPTSPDVRIRRALAEATGFLYLVGVHGTTGARKDLAPETLTLLERARGLRRRDRPPICVGFGISSADQVRRLVEAGTEGVIVGSALMQRLERGEDVKPLLQRLKRATVPLQ